MFTKLTTRVTRIAISCNWYVIKTRTSFYYKTFAFHASGHPVGVDIDKGIVLSFLLVISNWNWHHCESVKFDLNLFGIGIDPSHKSNNALDRYPTVQHFVTEMCTHVHISVTKCCIVGHGSVVKFDLNLFGIGIDPSHKSHNALDRYPTVQHFVTEMCTHVHISVTKCCIVGHGSVALWDLCDDLIAICRLRIFHAEFLLIEAETKKLTFNRRNFPMHFLEWKCDHHDSDLTEICSLVPYHQ